jgi:hypothetical protein
MSVFKNIEQKPCKHRAFVFFNICVRACDASQDRVDVHVIRDYGYVGVNAIYVPELFHPRKNDYDAHQNVDGNEYAP